MPQDGPQKVLGGPTMPQDSPRDVFLRGFLAGVQNHTCFYVSAVVSRRLTAPRYVFLRVFFLARGRASAIIICVFYVSAVVSVSFGGIWRHGYFLHAGGLLAGSYVKTRAASEQGETASV